MIFDVNDFDETLPGPWEWDVKRLAASLAIAGRHRGLSARQRGLIELCGWTLARAHARSGDAVAIGAYLGAGDQFDQALGRFAEAYADQNESDHAALATAVRQGRVAALSGV